MWWQAEWWLQSAADQTAVELMPEVLHGLLASGDGSVGAGVGVVEEGKGREVCKAEDLLNSLLNSLMNSLMKVEGVDLELLEAGA